MPVWADKLVQEVIRLFLEAYFEPQFSDHSHGFRQERGCHTALREVYQKWKGTVWFLEGDSSQCFDRLSHELLMEILSEHIHDGRFIRLMQELLDAGYMEDWTYNETLSGVPQGGIVSPILANILLDKWDQFGETVLIPQNTRGDTRKRSREYHTLMNQSRYHRKQGNVEKAEALRKQAQNIPATRRNDPEYRRLNYVRDADDFLRGCIGPKSEAEEIKRQLRNFLRDELKLALSEEKTLLTHAKSEAARFLGYQVIAFKEDTKRTLRNSYAVKARCSSINSGIGLQVPKDVLEEKCKRYTRKGKAIHRKELEQVSDYAILRTYQLEYRGSAEYDRLAYNMTK